MKHLYQRFVLFVTIIVMLITSSVVAHADSSALTWKEWNEYYCNSNQAIDKFFDYYSDNTTQELVLPDYFAGFRFEENGQLSVYITDSTDLVKDKIATVCCNSELKYELVENSFNNLTFLMESLDRSIMEKYDIKAATICIPENRVNVYFNDLAKSTSFYEAYTENVGCFYALPYISYQNIAETTNYPDGKIYSAPQAPVEKRESKGDEKGILATTLRFGGKGSDGTAQGTIGYLGLSYSGNKILVTHGHNLTTGNTYYYNGTAVGTVTSVLGTSNSLDAAVITLYSSGTTISNKAYWNTSYSFTNTADTYTAITSISGTTGYYRGFPNGVLGAEKQATISYAYQYGVYEFYLINGSVPVSGESGAPVYTKSGTTYKLLGIIKGYDQGSGRFISLAAIKNAYSHYVYLNNTNYS